MHSNQLSKFQELFAEVESHIEIVTLKISCLIMSNDTEDEIFNQLGQRDEDQDVNIESCKLITTYFRKTLERTYLLAQRALLLIVQAIITILPPLTLTITPKLPPLPTMALPITVPPIVTIPLQ